MGYPEIETKEKYIKISIDNNGSFIWIEKPQNCYIDDKGRIWKDKTLIKEAEKNKENYKMIDVDQYLASTVKWKVDTLFDMRNHVRRVQQCDLSIPIIIDETGRLIDGYHRVVKASVLGITQLAAVAITLQIGRAHV